MPVLALVLAALLFWMLSSSMKAFKADLAAAEAAGEPEHLRADFSGRETLLRTQPRLPLVLT